MERKVRINPNQLNRAFAMPVSAHFEGRLDIWTFKFTFLDTKMRIDSVQLRPGMNVPYLDSDGNPALCEPSLTVSPSNKDYESTISDEYGYWDHDNNGTYEPYGTVKWGPGDCDTMFVVYFRFYSDCTGDTITIDGELHSTFDWRGNTLDSVRFVKKIALVVGFDPGDVDGDGMVDMDDLTALVNYLVYNQSLNAWQLVGADVNCDGTVNMDDLTALINILVYNQGVSLDELEQALSGGTQTS